jgi:hypothetical protein
MLFFIHSSFVFYVDIKCRPDCPALVSASGKAPIGYPGLEHGYCFSRLPFKFFRIKTCSRQLSETMLEGYYAEIFQLAGRWNYINL